MTAYNGQYRCSGGRRTVTRWYGRVREFAICEVCDRGPLAVYPNGTVVMHKRETMLPVAVER